MDPNASLKQTVTNLFDAVRFADHAKELSQGAKEAEEELNSTLIALDSHAEELLIQLNLMKDERDEVLRELGLQLKEFLETAKEQAQAKLKKRASKRLEEFQGVISSERDKALKSLEAYFASDPLPLVENVVDAKLTDGLYEAYSRSVCEGGVKYEFTLAAQNSHLFHEPFSLSKLGGELKVPVRFSRGVLSKTRSPGFERLDQYVLVSAETSGGRIHASFEREGSGASMKLVTSGDKQDGFLGLEYSDQTTAVNVTNDPALVAHVDLEAVKKAAGQLAGGLSEVSNKKVALLRLSVDGEEVLGQMDARRVLLKVMEVMGPGYRTLVKGMPSAGRPGSPENGLSLEYIRSRLKLLGEEVSRPLYETLGLPLK